MRTDGASPKVEERFWLELFKLTDYLRERAARQIGISDDWNLTVQQSRLLRTIYYLTDKDYPDGVMLKTAAFVLGVTPAAVCGMVDNLVRRGLLTRVRCASNRRSVRIKLSEFSRKKINEIDILFSGFSKDLEPLVGEKEFISITESLEKINAGHPDLYSEAFIENKTISGKTGNIQK